MIYKIKLDGKVLYYPGDQLAAVINPELNLQTGYAGELTLKVPASNPLYDKIHNRKSMISVYRGTTEIFYGEVRTREKDRYKNQPIKATGALSFLADSILPQQEWHDMSPLEMLDAWLQLHNNQVEDRKKIYVGVVTIHDSNDSLYRITNRENTLQAIREKLVDRLGGYLRLRHEDDKLYLDWISIEEYGKYCEQPIKFGKNLLDYSETMTSDDIITALIPLGAAIERNSSESTNEFEQLEKNVDITSVNDGKDYIYSKEAVENFGWVWKTQKWEDVTIPANLLKKATEYLTTQQYESLVISLTAVDLSIFGQDYDSFDVGDRILCNAEPYGMKKILPVMEMKIPLQQPDQAQLTLGENLQQSFTDQTTGTISQIRQETTEAGRTQKEWMKTAIDNLTKQIAGAKGGYKLTEYDENGLWLRDLYMDAPNKEDTTNILQITKNGIGGSHEGYAGPYSVGMTLDGQLVGERLQAGSVKTEALSVECKEYIESEISDADEENKKAILKEVNTSIKTATDSITLSIASLEQSLEKKSGNWYGNYEPTNENNPASAWTAEELKQEHERDIFFNTVTGYAYQYQKNDKDEYAWVRIKDEDIEAAADDAKTALSEIKVQDAKITAEVKRAKGVEEELKASITLTEETIETKVSKGDIASAINQTAQAVKIKAEKIDFTGLVTANEYFKILEDGSMECLSGKMGGFYSNETSFYAYATGSYKMEINSDEKKVKISDGTTQQITHRNANRATVVIGGATTTALLGNIDCAIGNFDSVKTQSVKATTASSFNAITSSANISAGGKITASSHVETDGHFYSTGTGTDLADLSVRGTKKRVLNTQDYGTQAFYCYEMASPVFGDIGKASISEDGTCLIDIDDIFQESANTEFTYYVFLQKEGEGDCWIEEKEATHFTVKGTPGLKFSFEVKAMQVAYEHMRFADPAETAYDRAVEDLDYNYMTESTEVEEPDYESELEEDRIAIINRLEAAA